MNENKWLNSSYPSINEFKVDKTQTEYYVQYTDSKTIIDRLDGNWINTKKGFMELKQSIEEINSALDSDDFRQKMSDVLEAIDTSVLALDENFKALFTHAVKRLAQSVETDDWFSSTAVLYAEYIWTSILGNAPFDKSKSISSQVPSYMPKPAKTDDIDVSTSDETASDESQVDVDNANVRSGEVNKDEINVNDEESSLPSGNGSGGGTGSQPTSGSTGSETVAYNDGDQPEDATVTISDQQLYNSSAPATSTVDTSKYHDKPESGFVVTTNNPTYDLSDHDIEIITAIVSAESDKSYDDALAVASTIFNRAESSKWAYLGANNPLKQATAPNQFVVYQHGSYKKYMGDGAPDTCKQAVLDVINGARNHNYLSFRSNGSKNYSSNMITSSGNRYK